MLRIPTNELQAGMVLENDVNDLSGRMLLKAGTTFQEKHLRVLRTWGISAVDIAGDNDVERNDSIVELSELAPEVIATIESEIASRFVGVDSSHPVMASLIKLVTKDLVKQHLLETSDA